MREKRDETIILRLSKTEKNRIYEKMLSMGCLLYTSLEVSQEKHGGLERPEVRRGLAA